MAENSHQKEYFEVKTEVELLKRDIAVFGGYFQKIDAMIDKIGDATMQMTKMITLHDERIQNQIEEDRANKELIELNRQESTKEIKALEKRIDDKFTSIDGKFDAKFDKLETSISQFQVSVKKMESWRTLIIGGAIVILFFLSKATQSYFDAYFQNRVTAPITQTTK